MNKADIPSEDVFVQLMALATESPDMRAHLVAVLSQDTFNRTSMLNTMISDLQLRGAPQPLVDCISFLLDAEVAERALRLIRQ